MSKLKFSVLTLSLCLFSAAASAVTTLGAVTEGGDLVLIDPSQPIGAGNPELIDEALSNHEQFSAVGFITGKVNGTVISGLHNGRLAYIKAGTIYRVNPAAGVSHLPAQVSNITNACELTPYVDFANINHSWIRVLVAGTDGNCFTPDDTNVMTGLNFAPTASPKVISGLVNVVPVHDPLTGAIIQFITTEGPGGKVLRSRNGALGGVQSIMTLANSSIEAFATIQTQQFYRLTPAGETLARLYRYDVASHSSTLIGPLYVFTGSNIGQVERGAADASNYYFADASAVLRMPLNAVDMTAGHNVGFVPAAVTALHLAPDSDFLVIEANASSPCCSGGVFSMSKLQNNGPATTLRATDAANGKFVGLVASSPNFAFINEQNLITSKVSTVRVNLDGTNPVVGANTYWVGPILPTSIDFSKNSSPLDNPPSLVRAAKGAGFESMRVFSATTGAAGKVLGNIANTTAQSGAFAVAVGRFGLINASIQRDPSNQDFDLYFFDVNTTNSLTPALTSTVNEYALH